MSIEAQSAVWGHSVHSGNTLFVLVALADNADGEVFEAYPSYDYLAAKTRLGKRTVQDAVKALLGTDELTLVERGTQGRCNVYRVEVDVLRSKPRIQVAKSATSGGSRGGSRGGSPGGRASATQPSTSNRQSSTVSPQSEETVAVVAVDDDGQLFETEVQAPTPDDRVDYAARLQADVRDVWTGYVQVFGDRLRVRDLTGPRERTIRKALKAAGHEADQDVALELCQRAIHGLKSYRQSHPQGSQDVGISVIFETGPHSKSNLTDQIQWWADQAERTVPTPGGGVKFPIDLTGVPSVTKGRIQARRREVAQMFDHPESPDAQRRGEAAVDWLKEHIGHAPKIEDDKLRGWEYV